MNKSSQLSRRKFLGLTAVTGAGIAAGFLASPHTTLAQVATEAPNALPPAPAFGPIDLKAAGGMDALIEAAKKEAELSTIALPDDWANYGEIKKNFLAKYPFLKHNDLDPNGSSAEEIEAIKANAGNKGPQNPDVIDVGFIWGEDAKKAKLLQPYKVAGEAPDFRKKRVGEMLDIIHMAEFGNRCPHQLSGGQQQRVALARALAIRPQVLLLDEPLSALDAKIRLSLRQEIRSIQRQLGITTIYVTHDQEEALSISDRIVVMNRGKIEQVGTPLEIYNAPQTRFVALFVGTLNVLKAQVVERMSKRIAIDGQELCVEQSIPDTTDTHVSVALRPEAVVLANGTHAAMNSVRGTVEDIYFLGSVVRIRVRLMDQAINMDTFNNPNMTLPAHGENVTLSFPPHACMMLHAEA